MKRAKDARIAVIGLGYVGLPLAVAFAQNRRVIGFDIDPQRVAELRSGHDRTREVDDSTLANADVAFTHDEDALHEADVYIVTAPTPIDEHKKPDLKPLLAACQTISRHLCKQDVVIFESTVYPGATEEDCVPVLESGSGLNFNQDFFVGYSPERINPGDKKHTVSKILKITSGSTPAALDFVDELYRSIVTAGTHRAPTIRVAEAAKVIENTQRDVNIGLINELAILFDRMGIDTEAVLTAAGTKWNFLPFRPGLVGGHCIGVDPYYLTHKAQQLGYHPEIILAGRRLNDSMPAYVASQLVKRMTKEGIPVRGARVLILGLTFKENTPDMRNSRVVDIIQELREYMIAVDVVDPWCDAHKVQVEHDIHILREPQSHTYDGVIVAVAHDEFRKWDAAKVREFGKRLHVLYDLKYLFARDQSDARL